MVEVVTCILMDEKGKILILKRSDKVSTYRGCWSGVAGYVEKGEKPIDTAFKEISEEVKLEKDDVVLEKSLPSIEFSDVYEGKEYDWKIYPFLFKTGKKDKIVLDWENTDFSWIEPADIVKYDTVPHLEEVIIMMLL